MAPLPEDNTHRFYYHYANAINPHTLVIRATAGTDLAAADALVAAILTAIGANFPASTITGVEESAQGSNLRFPVASARTGDTFGGGTGSVEQDAIAIMFGGRSLGGRRMRLFLFGWGGGFSANFRIQSVENAGVASAINALGASTAVPKAIDGFEGTWKSYANVKPNDHWVKQGRS